MCGGTHPACKSLSQAKNWNSANKLTHWTSRCRFTTLSLSSFLLFRGTVCSLIDSVAELDSVEMSPSPWDALMCHVPFRTVSASSTEQTWTCCMPLQIHLAGAFPPKVTHYTRDTACLNGSVAVLLNGLLENSLAPLWRLSLSDC